MSNTTNKREKLIRDPKHPGNVAVLTREPSGRWTSEVYVCDILAYSASYHADNRALAVQDAESFVREQLPRGFYSDPDLTFADVRQDR